jgi:redox-sensitive bicupin YhaK (pirin superfamily)
MSAGTGIFHSEMNASQKEEINLFQIWIFPNKQGVTPRYEQKSYDLADTEQCFLPLVTPQPSEKGVWIHQDAWIHMATMDENTELTYQLKSKGNGIYLMNIDGRIELANEALNRRDAIGISETDEITIFSKQKSRLLVIEVPMQF